MSESPSGASSHPVRPLNYASPEGGMQPFSLLRVGGALGIAASCIGLLFFMIGCFGVSIVFRWFPLIPLLLSATGLVMSLIGATLRKAPGDEDTHVMAALFVTTIGLIGAVLELAVGFHWTLFFPTGSAGT